MFMLVSVVHCYHTNEMQYTCACVIVYHVCHGYYGKSYDVSGDSIFFDLRITGCLLHKHRKTIYQLEANTKLYLMLQLKSE